MEKERQGGKEEQNINVQKTSSVCHPEGYMGKLSGKLETVLLDNRHFCHFLGCESIVAYIPTLEQLLSSVKASDTPLPDLNFLTSLF